MNISSCEKGETTMTNKERFISLCGQIHRNGIDKLMEWLESTDFYAAPASTRFHLSCESGLLTHSLNVYDELKRLLKAYPEIQISDESVAIAALFHDLCKVNCHKPETRNKKNDSGVWESYTTYNRKEDFCYGGHGSKSVYLIQKFMSLTDEEAVAINCHMSCWDGNMTVGDAFTQFPFAWLLHVADESATYISEKE